MNEQTIQTTQTIGTECTETEAAGVHGTSGTSDATAAPDSAGTAAATESAAVSAAAPARPLGFTRSVRRALFGTRWRLRSGIRQAACFGIRLVTGRGTGSAARAVAGLAAGLTAMLAAAPALAASSFGDMADSVKSEVTKFGPMLQAGFALGGFFLVGLGLWQLWARSQQPGSPKGSALMAIVIGCGLLGAATIAQMGSGTLGTGDPELSHIGL